jgi:kynurenine formamidase
MVVRRPSSLARVRHRVPRDRCGIEFDAVARRFREMGKIQDFGDEAAFQVAEPGVGRDAAIWLYEQGMAVLGTDTTGTEPLPFKDAALTTHWAMLVERGVHLIENLFLEDVAAAGVKEGIFVGLPLRITGGTGSWLRPVLVT